MIISFGAARLRLRPLKGLIIRVRIADSLLESAQWRELQRSGSDCASSKSILHPATREFYPRLTPRLGAEVAQCHIPQTTTIPVS